VHNGNLIKKIYLPRELFPIASVWVSAVHFFPQIVVLVIACIFTGWQPGPFELLAAIAGFTIVALLATGLGLLFGAANVYYRDSENIVDMLLMIATWASPVLYAWTMVQRQLGDVAFAVYQANHDHGGRRALPLRVLVPDDERFLTHAARPFQPLAAGRLVISVTCLVLGQITFRRLEGRCTGGSGGPTQSKCPASASSSSSATPFHQKTVVWLAKGRRVISPKFHALKDVSLDVRAGRPWPCSASTGRVNPRC
jgi:ABC-2 type transport system permease protein